MNLSQRLKVWREGRGMTVRQAAAVFRVSHSLYHYWERGERWPGVQRLGVIAGVLGISAEEMLRLCADRAVCKRRG